MLFFHSKKNSAEDLASLFRRLGDRVFVFDAGLEFRELNEDARDVEEPWWPVVVRSVGRALNDGKEQHLELSAAKGEDPVGVHILPFDGDRVFVVVRPLGDIDESRDEIKHLAFYDALTGLPSRDSFINDARSRLERAGGDNERAALLYVDLDHFKRVNDSFGHSAGDELLKSVARRLRNSSRAQGRNGASNGADCSCQIARLGGDEFALLLTDKVTHDSARAASERILKDLSEPFVHENRQCRVTPSIGIAMFPEHGTSFDELLDNADLAMYQAKESGRNAYRFFTGTMSVRSMERLHIERELRRAIENDDLHLVYQPKFNLKSGRVTGVEAFLRWNQAELGEVPPAKIVRVAEDTGLVEMLGQWVTHAACDQAKVWQGTGLENLRISLNISAREFELMGFSTALLETCVQTGVSPSCFEIEVSERAFVAARDTAFSQLQRLRDRGVSVAIDDFGTGQLSLEKLRFLSLDKLKIDNVFVQEIERKGDGAGLCKSMIMIGLQLGLDVAAEGVETAAQFRFLKKAGCCEIQGNYFCEPCDAPGLAGFIQDLRGPAKKEISANDDVADPDADTWKLKKLRTSG